MWYLYLGVDGSVDGDEASRHAMVHAHSHIRLLSYVRVYRVSRTIRAIRAIWTISFNLRYIYKYIYDMVCGILGDSGI